MSRKQTVVWLIRTGEGTQLQNWRCEAKQPRAGKEATVLRGDVRRGDWEEVVGKRGEPWTDARAWKSGALAEPGHL